MTKKNWYFYKLNFGIHGLPTIWYTWFTITNWYTLKIRKKEKKNKNKKVNKTISSIDLLASYGSEGDPRDDSGLVYNLLFYLIVIR